MKKVKIKDLGIFDRAWRDFEDERNCPWQTIPIEDYMKHLRKAWGICELPSGMYVVDDKKYAMFLLRYG